MNLKIVVAVIAVSLFSCGNPETVVTDIVHPDGSVTRKVEIRNSKNEFKLRSVQVPIDETWNIRDSIEIGKKGDTTWVRRATKSFANVSQLNRMYRADSSTNNESVRHAEFSKHFRWFNTEYFFSETIEKNLGNGYPIKEFLNDEQLEYFYMPDKMKEEHLKSADSLKYRALADTLDKRKDKWEGRSIISEWISEFDRLAGSPREKELTLASMKEQEGSIVGVFEKHQNVFDSVWASGVIVREIFGDKLAAKYRVPADSAMSVVIKKALISFSDYTIRIEMPGRLTGTNGLIDSSRRLAWPVKSDYFFTEPYIMWAESKTTNVWAWIVTGAFIVFVVTGLVVRKVRK